MTPSKRPASLSQTTFQSTISPAAESLIHIILPYFYGAPTCNVEACRSQKKEVEGEKVAQWYNIRAHPSAL